MRKILLTICLALLIPFQVWAGTINVSSYGDGTCSNSNVALALADAISGDTVECPACAECTWTGAVTVPAGVKLMGQGIGNTIVKYATETKIITLSDSSRVTGFTFQNGYLSPEGDGYRIDNNRFEGLAATTLNLYGILSYNDGRGLIDHNQFYNSKIVPLGGSVVNNAAWATNLGLGTDDAVYIENNWLYSAFDSVLMDTNYGGAYVARYNTIQNQTVMAHAVQGNNRATRKFEIYNNRWTISDASTAYTKKFGFLRAGTGVVYNNEAVGLVGWANGKWRTPYFYIDEQRSCATKDTSGECNGSSLWDGNTAIGHDAFSLATYGDDGNGTHDGAGNAAALTDSTKTWTVDALIGITVYNVTDGSSCEITDNDGTTVTCTLAGGTENDWDAGDTYKVTDGYPCRDQQGRSLDNPQWVSSPAGAYTQALDPLYAWNNFRYDTEEDRASKTSGSAITIEFEGTPCAISQAHVVDGRDYYNNGTTAKVGYTAYPFPHELDTEHAGWTLITADCTGHECLQRLGNTTLGSGSTFTFTGSTFTLQ